MKLKINRRTLTSVMKLCTKPLTPPFSLIDVHSLMKKKFKLPRYFSILPPGTYPRGVMSTPYRSRTGSYFLYLKENAIHAINEKIAHP